MDTERNSQQNGTERKINAGKDQMVESPGQPVPPDEGTAPQAAEIPEITGAPAAEDAADLRDRIIEECQKEKEDLYDRLLRKQAEFENYRKRQDRERKDLAQVVKAEVISEFLPVADACERALKAIATAGTGPSDPGSFRSGVELIYKQFQDILARFNVLPIDAVGQKFDPLLHHAIMREETDQHPENQILEELQKGYTCENRLLRPSQVKVAIPRLPQEKKQNS